MYERFTDRARKVMQLANQEAQRFQHEYIGTEHILLGLIKEGTGVAANVLHNLDVDLKKVRLGIERLVQSGPDMVIMGKLPHTPRAKAVIEFAMAEARELNHHYVGTEHILLGLLREGEGVAAEVLRDLGLKLEDVREEVLSLVGEGAGGERGRITNFFVDFGATKVKAIKTTPDVQMLEDVCQQLNYHIYDKLERAQSLDDLPVVMFSGTGDTLGMELDGLSLYDDQVDSFGDGKPLFDAEYCRKKIMKYAHTLITLFKDPLPTE